ncbi:MAG: GAF domain-containing protein, partial [Clostridiales bacterium]|nr:GAF domain-containing protein [Clostridiales bacterium]
MIKSDESHKQPHTIQQGIYEVAELLLNVSSNAELGEYVLKASEIVGHTVGVDRVTLCRNEMIDDEIHFVIDYIFANEITKQFDKQLVEGIAIPYSDLPAWENMFLHGGCIAGPISEMGIVEQEFFSDFGTKSLVTVPIFFHEHLWGFLSAATCVDERDYNENEIEFLRLVSLMMASAVARVTMADKIKEANYLSLVQMEAIIEERTSALERALSSSKKTQATLERREKMLSALNRMSVILLSNNDETFENTMNRGLKLITEAAGVDRIAVYKRLGKSMSRLGQIYLWHGGTKPIEESARELPENPPVLRWLGKLWKGEGINSDASALPKDEFDFLDFFGVKGIYFVPIFIKAVFWGVVTLEDHTRYRTFDEDCLDLLQSAAHLCASVIIRTEMESNAAESMETLEHRSELINIANKIAFALLAPDNEVTFKESLATSLDMLGHFTNADIV